MQRFLDSVSNDTHTVIVGTSDEVNTMYQTHYSQDFPLINQNQKYLQQTHPDLFAIINNPLL
ncbi:MAG: hypothetical protein NZL83_00380 [Candidatus Absconditabacterales bacterium]|nr:hypothetical protein [Candidatus Absconditabacterales bacterium]